MEKSELTEKIEEKKAIDEICDNIISQLESATAKNKMGLGRADDVWFAKARGALRHNRRKRQELQDEISELKRKEKQIHNSSQDKEFLKAVLDIAKNNLTDEQYDKILEGAKKTVYKEE